MGKMPETPEEMPGWDGLVRLCCGDKVEARRRLYRDIAVGITHGHFPVDQWYLVAHALYRLTIDENPAKTLGLRNKKGRPRDVQKQIKAALFAAYLNEEGISLKLPADPPGAFEVVGDYLGLHEKTVEEMYYSFPPQRRQDMLNTAMLREFTVLPECQYVDLVESLNDFQDFWLPKARKKMLRIKRED